MNLRSSRSALLALGIGAALTVGLIARREWCPDAPATASGHPSAEPRRTATGSR